MESAKMEGHHECPLSCQEPPRMNSFMPAILLKKNLLHDDINCAEAFPTPNLMVVVMYSNVKVLHKWMLGPNFLSVSKASNHMTTVIKFVVKFHSSLIRESTHPPNPHELACTCGALFIYASLVYITMDSPVINPGTPLSPTRPWFMTD